MHAAAQFGFIEPQQSIAGLEGRFPFEAHAKHRHHEGAIGLSVIEVESVGQTEPGGIRQHPAGVDLLRKRCACAQCVRIDRHRQSLFVFHPRGQRSLDRGRLIA